MEKIGVVQNLFNFNIKLQNGSLNSSIQMNIHELTELKSTTLSIIKNNVRAPKGYHNLIVPDYFYFFIYTFLNQKNNDFKIIHFPLNQEFYIRTLHLSRCYP